MSSKNNLEDELSKDLESIRIILQNFKEQLDKNNVENIYLMLNKKINEVVVKGNTVKPLFIGIGVWILTALVFVISGLLLQNLSNDILAFMDKISSWITTVAIISCGLTAGTYAYRHSKFLGICVWIAWGAIFTNYFAYVTIDYGDLHPHVSAIGFNIATTFQSIALLFVCFIGLIAFLNHIFKVSLHDHES